ncbi:MAG: hypothetical protein ACHQ5A_04505 [Opitutales bacterium]
MHSFLINNLAHVVAGILFLSRIGDIGTTYLVTPTFMVEINPLARRLGWKYAIATLLVALIPYRSMPAGIVVVTVSLLVSAANAWEVLLARTLGEQEYARMVNAAMARTSLATGLFYLLLPSWFVGILGGTMLIFFPNPSSGWGFYFALGFLGYTFAMTLGYPVHYFRVRNSVRSRLPNAEGHVTRNPPHDP